MSAIYKEWVDFREKIGIWKDKSERESDADTNVGIIHYGKGGAHIVPANPHKEGDYMNIGYIRSSIQVALLGNITPNLRAVSVECEENKIKIIFYYQTPPSEEEQELASLADTEFISDFPPTFNTNFQIIHLPKSQAIPKRGFLVYLRYEPI